MPVGELAGGAILETAATYEVVVGKSKYILVLTPTSRLGRLGQAIVQWYLDISCTCGVRAKGTVISWDAQVYRSYVVDLIEVSGLQLADWRTLYGVFCTILWIEPATCYSLQT